MLLSAEQQRQLDNIAQWMKSTNDQIYVLAGYAGTGKTTLAQHIANQTSGTVVFCSYTGKAALALKQRGAPNATTIHRALYLPKMKSQQRLVELKQAIDTEPNPAKQAKLRQEYQEERKKLSQPSFKLNPDSLLAEAELVVIDEYSMVTEDILSDLKRMCKKILALGDPFQLPPIGRSNDLKPNGFLEEVHRQALDSPILRAATQVRMGQPIDCADGETFITANKGDFGAETYAEVDQVIVARNKTRNKINRHMRKYLGFTDKMVCRGEKLICLKNYHDLEIYNGSLGQCSSDPQDAGECFVADVNINGAKHYDMKLWKERFEDPFAHADHRVYNEFHDFDYGYAITCHKAQGSEFPSVLVYNEGLDRDRYLEPRWLYTAITRAQNKLILINARSK